MNSNILKNTLSADGKHQKQGIWAIFLLAAALIVIDVVQLGSMVSRSGDAADIWKTIKSFRSEEIYPSYVMYKGFFSIYPYVWLYELAELLSLNDFFFIMCYHAALFGYITVVGIPVMAERLTGYRAKLWQRAAVVLVLYWFWDRYRVLTQIMVDLPSCAFFIMSIHCAVKLEENTGWKRCLFAAMTGFLCGICANISGQYSISSICIMVFAGIALWKSASVNNKKLTVFSVAALILAMTIAKFLNIWFEARILTPIRESGVYIATGQAWMERALFYMLDIGRKFYGPDLADPRGNAIVMNIYGTEEGTLLLEKAAMGVYGWSIPEYFKAFFKYPIDFIMLYLNRFMIMISDDSGKSLLRSLLASYTMIYLSAVTCITRLKKMSDIVSAKFWLVLGTLASIIPSLVMCIEIRVTISVQALFYGVALAGPILPQIGKNVVDIYRQCKQDKSLHSLSQHNFPWGIVGWLIFCLICLAYFGSICAGSGLGEKMLYRW